MLIPPNRRNTIVVAVVVEAKENNPEKLIAALNALRTQTLVPWFVRILDYDGWVEKNDEVTIAISNLRMFSPNVRVLRVGYYEQVAGANMTAYINLQGAKYDVLVHMSSDIVLKQDGLRKFTEAFYDPNILTAQGNTDHVEPTERWWNRISGEMRIGNRLHAYRAFLITSLIK